MAVVTLMTPEKIRNAVKDQLRRDNRLDDSGIAVDVRGNEVALTGTVNSIEERLIAESDAAIIDGVEAVDNRLQVRYEEPPEDVTDEKVRENIGNMIRWNSSIDSSKITVKVAGGVVTLEGTVSSHWQKLKTGEIAESARGVLDVNNDLSVDPLRKLADQVIREDVIAAFQRNMGDAASGIAVTVDDGVATLQGTVSDLSLYRAAGDIAYYTDGVIAVRNDLLIQSVEP